MGLKIPSKRFDKDDGYSTFSIRIKTEVLEKLDQLAKESGRSRNYIITKILESSIDDVLVVDPNISAAETSEKEKG